MSSNANIFLYHSIHRILLRNENYRLPLFIWLFERRRNLFSSTALYTNGRNIIFTASVLTGVNVGVPTSAHALLHCRICYSRYANIAMHMPTWGFLNWNYLIEMTWFLLSNMKEVTSTKMICQALLIDMLIDAFTTMPGIILFRRRSFYCVNLCSWPK